jgi:hypothetical protein
LRRAEVVLNRTAGAASDVLDEGNASMEMPPPYIAVLPRKRTSVSVGALRYTNMPPPACLARLPLKSTSVRVGRLVELLYIAPPYFATFPTKATDRIVGELSRLNSPPP